MIRSLIANNQLALLISSIVFYFLGPVHGFPYLTNPGIDTLSRIVRDYQTSPSLWKNNVKADSLERIAATYSNKKKSDEQKKWLFIAKAIINRSHNAPSSFFSPAKPKFFVSTFYPQDEKLLPALFTYIKEWLKLNQASRITTLSIYCQTDQLFDLATLEQVGKSLATTNVPNSIQDQINWLKKYAFATADQRQKLAQRSSLLFQQIEPINFTDLQNKYAQLLSIYQAKITRNQPESLIDYLILKMDWADYLWYQQHSMQAQSLYESVWTDVDQQLANRTDIQFRMLRRLGQFFIQTQTSDKAIYYLNRAQDIALLNYGNKSEEYANVLTDLAYLYANRNPARALQLVQESVSTLKQKNSAGFDYLSALALTAELQYQSRQFMAARQIYEQIIPIVNDLLGSNHPQYAIAFYNLAALEQSLRNIDKATDLYQTSCSLQARYVAVAPDQVDRQSPFVQTAYPLLGLLKSGIKLTANGVPSTQGELIVQLNRTAATFAVTNQYALIDSLYKPIKAAISQSTHKPSAYFDRMLDYSRWLMETKQFNKSEQLLADLQPTIEEAFGTTSRLYRKTLLQLANIQQKQGYTLVAKQLLERVFNLTDQLQQVVGQLLPQNSSQIFMLELDATYTELLHQITYLYTTYPELATMAYSITLRQKETLIQNQRTVYRYLLDDEQLATYYETYQSTRNTYQSEFQKNRLNLSELRLLQQRIAAIEEKMLLHLSQRKQKKIKIWPINWESVQTHLKPEEGVVEYFQLPYTNQGPATYWAMVGNKTTIHPTLLPICPESALINLLNYTNPDSINALYNHQRLYQEKNLRQWIWQPLQPLLSGVKHVYYAPVGLMNQISFSGLWNGTDTSITHHQLLSSRSIIPLPISTIDRSMSIPASLGYLPGMADAPKISQFSRFSLWGGIDFKADVNLRLGQNATLKRHMTLELELVKNNKNPFSVEKHRLDIRGRDEPLTSETSNDGQPIKTIWKYLPGTRTEIDHITEELNQYNQKPPIRVFTRSSATEEAFKFLEFTANVWGMGSPEFLHVATHGFLHDRDRSNHTLLPFDDPLMRSGLILAGGETTWQSNTRLQSGIDDGVLSAYEISNLNLSNTKLVVLSACETALGDNMGSEGIFGLQRAFKIAGVGSIIMSLWKVPDDATAQMMRQFYRGIGQKKTIDVAFTEAQFYMKKRFPPYAWAGFVLVK